MLGALLILFGLFTFAILALLAMPGLEVVSTLIFCVAGAMLLTYGILTRETPYAYAMPQMRAGLYAIGVSSLSQIPIQNEIDGLLIELE